MGIAWGSPLEILAEEGDFGIADNRILDQWTFPFGAWMEQITRWVDQNAQGVLEVIEWPFTFLFRNFVKSPAHHPFWEITDMPWIAVCFGVFLAGSLVRNMRVGLMTAAATALCGVLGVEYWDETAVTIGMILVAVLLCAIIGIPIGILCGRVDGVWGAVRPVLDAMQVIHSFVYMLPVIFFWGIGPEPACMVTMVFALPPLIRLTNLGIRQVPADVVEASRSYGASELRVLTDVQLPLARPAIMTGLNQTLLLSIAMLGIAAIMAAGGLGLLVFRAVQNLDVTLAASAGLALFLVAVVLDRISQREETDGLSLFDRVHRAWTHRNNPEDLLQKVEVASAADSASEGQFARVEGIERKGVLVALVGAIVGLVSLPLTWSTGSGLLAAYARLSEAELAGQSFNGIAASGGTYYGLFVGAVSVFVLFSAIVTLRRPGTLGRWVGADGALIASLATVFCMISYHWISPSGFSAEHTTGVGAWLGLVATLVMAAGAACWIFGAPYVAKHPLRAKRSWSKVVISGVMVIMLVAGGYSGWLFDGRSEAVVSPELQAEIEALKAEGRAAEERGDLGAAGIIGAQISGLVAKAQRTEVVITDGFTDKGPGIGTLGIVVGLIATAAVALSAGFIGHDERLKWIWSSVAAGIGAGLMLISLGWVISLLRVADPNVVSGAGSFLMLVAGFGIMSTTRGVMKEFHRGRVYDEDHAAV